MAELTKIEILSEKALLQEFGDAEGRAIWASYVAARHEVFTNLLPHIRRTEPFLTDHDVPHILNVLQNAYELLDKAGCSGKSSDKSLAPTELYFLVLSILFHDVGNIFGRKGHKSKIQEAYAFAMPKGTPQEKRLLTQIVEAHGGLTSQGSSDTIGALDSNAIFKAKRLDVRRVAAILRFADELAEGPQRTSGFVQKHLPVPPDVQVYHDYAEITTIHIDRQSGRIAIVYHIEICPEAWGKSFNEKRLAALLRFIYLRLIKLDLERKYNRHFCSLLLPFKQTEASFYFFHRGQELDLALPKVVLDDLILPDGISSVEAMPKYSVYEITRIMPKLAGVAENI